MKKKADTLEQAIPNLDHTRSLTVEELDSFYVDRKEVSEMLAEMQIQFENQYPCKGLLTGYRGAGKSSALTKLGQKLEERNRLWVVHFSLLDKLDLNDLDYIDIVFLMAVEILETLRERQVDIGGFDARLQNWVTEVEIVREEQQSLDVSAETKVELNTPNLGWLTLPVRAMLSVGAKVGKEVATRKTIREQLEPQFSELLGIIDDLQQGIFKNTEKRLICLIDGPDKASIRDARHLFYETGFYLAAPQCSIIYTFPVALQNSKDFNQIKPYFNETYFLPNFKVQSRRDHEDEGQRSQEDVQAKGIALLKEVIARRADSGLFQDDALDKLVYASGGIVRTAIMLTQKACVKALARGLDKVSTPNVEAAIAEERRDFDRQLSQKQRDLLRNVLETEGIDTDPEAGYLDLLHNLSVIEYINGDTWYGVSPIVTDLI